MSDEARSLLKGGERIKYLGHYFNSDNPNHHKDCITQEVLAFKRDEEASIHLWTNKIRELVENENFPKVDVIVRALGHDEFNVSSDTNKPLDKLARSLADALDVAYHPEALEKRKKRDEPPKKMIGLNKNQRYEQVRGVYSVNSSKKLPKFKSTFAFLVVDDVRTTGATTSEIWRAINKEYGTKARKHIFTLVHTSGGEPSKTQLQLQDNERLFSYLQGRKE